MYTIVGKLANMQPACQYVADATLHATISPDLINAFITSAPDGVIVIQYNLETLLMTDRGQLINAPAGALVRTTRLNPSEYPEPGDLLREIAAVVKLARSEQWHAQPQPEID